MHKGILVEEYPFKICQAHQKHTLITTNYST